MSWDIDHAEAREKLYITTDYASGRPEIIPFGNPRNRPLREMSMVLTTEALAEIVRQGQEWLDAERQIAIRAIWVDGPDSEARRARTPDPTHTPAVRRVVAWETHGGELERERDDAYWSVAMDMIASAYRRCPSRLRGETVDGWWNLHWRWPRVSRLAAYLRHRDEKAGYR